MKRLLFIFAGFIASLCCVADAGSQTVRCTVNGVELSCSYDSAATEPGISLIVVESLLKLGVLSHEDITENSGAPIGQVAEYSLVKLREVTVGGLPVDSLYFRTVGAIEVPLVFDSQSLLPFLQKARETYKRADFYGAVGYYAPLYAINAIGDTDKYRYAWSLACTGQPAQASEVLKTCSHIRL